MNIAFVAMSGIRVCDTELLGLGLTLPGFVERSKIIASLPSLGLLTLAGMTPARHHRDYFEIADLAAGDDVANRLSEYDLVAISSYSAQMGEAYDLSDRLRREGSHVVLGGLHVTACAEEAAGHADSVVIGEGEACWQDLLSDAEKCRLKPVYDVSGYEYDLTHSPTPAYELLDPDKYNRLTVQTSRGCPHLCEFCAGSVLLTRRYKQKPVSRVLAELDRIGEIWPRSFIEFADDNSVVDTSYWWELLPHLAERRLRWFTETDISVARDEDLLACMRNSGCAQLLIGLESTSRPPLDGLETRANWKWQHWSDYRQAIETIQGHGISVNGCFVIGLDDHDGSVFDEIFEFVEETGLHEVQVTMQTPFPGTPLYDRLLAEDRLIDARAWNRCTLFDVNYHPKLMSAEELRDGYRDLVLRLYSEGATRRRRERFRRSLRDLRTRG